MVIERVATNTASEAELMLFEWALREEDEPSFSRLVSEMSDRYTALSFSRLLPEDQIRGFKDRVQRLKAAKDIILIENRRLSTAARPLILGDKPLGKQKNAAPILSDPKLSDPNFLAMTLDELQRIQSKNRGKPKGHRAKREPTAALQGRFDLAQGRLSSETLKRRSRLPPKA
jgi:hypothetical protein